MPNVIKRLHPLFFRSGSKEAEDFEELLLVESLNITAISGFRNISPATRAHHDAVRIFDALCTQTLTDILGVTAIDSILYHIYLFNPKARVFLGSSELNTELVNV